MLASLFLIAAITLGGLGVTYLFEREEPLLWRIAAGNVIGCAIFGTLGFVLAMAFGLNPAVVVATLLITISPILLAARGDRRKTFDHDLAKAKGRVQGSKFVKLGGFFYYAAFVLLFIFFFDRAMVVNDQGIFTGGSNNLGDLPFHLGVIYGFSEGMNFPPENPNWAGATFSYPFVADLITACFVKLGIGVRDSMFVQNVVWAFSLLVLLVHFVRRITANDLAARLAPPILFFSGGLGFVWFFSDYLGQARGFFEFLSALPKDYTIGDEFRWGNSLITLFLTQRSLLLGMPISLIVLGFLWSVFAKEPSETEPRQMRDLIPAFVLGLVAGLLPLIHLHSLAVIFVVSAFILAMRRNRWRELIAFGIGVCIVVIPELIWSTSGSATRASEFIAWHFGFDARDTNIVWFWIKNTGAFIPLLTAGIYLWFFPPSREEAKPDNKTRKKKDEAGIVPAASGTLLYFYVPFFFLFILANVTKLAPWEWDNIKVLIYWFVGSIPFVAIALAWMWRKDAMWKAVAGLLLAVLCLSGALDVWRTVSGQINYQVFSADAITLADRIRAVTAPRSMFLNAPTYNTAAVLTGRRSLMRYPGHLSSHGIDYRQREEDVKRMYRGGPDATELLEKYGIEYVVISPEERSLGPNEAFFSRFPIVAQSGDYRVHKIK
ncbi:MAG TPA: hypothetical protein VFZ49_01330 [Pyrinomonadaceae bacterium]